MSKLPKITVEKSKKLPPAKYQGRIMSWDSRPVNMQGGEQVTFCDLHIAVKDPADGETITLKTGFAANRVTPDSKLGKLLARFGQEITPGREIDLEAVLNGLVKQDVTFRTTTEKTETGEFTRIDPDSLAPALTSGKK